MLPGLVHAILNFAADETVCGGFTTVGSFFLYSTSYYTRWHFVFFLLKAVMLYFNDCTPQQSASKPRPGQENSHRLGFMTSFFESKKKLLENLLCRSYF